MEPIETATVIEQRKARITEALKRRGVDDLLEVNPTPVNPIVEERPVGEATVIPWQDIPAGFTDEQHAARNAHLPAAPTREQFKAGLVRSFNLHLQAEYWEHALTAEELEYLSEQEKTFDILGRLYYKSRVNLVDTDLTSSELQGFRSVNHKKLLVLHHVATSIWVNFFGRSAIMMTAVLCCNYLISLLAG